MTLLEKIRELKSENPKSKFREMLDARVEAALEKIRKIKQNSEE